MVNILLSIAPIGDIALFLIFSFMLVTCREITVIIPIVVLIVGLGATFKVHLLFKILISLGKMFNGRGKGLQ